jgi:hypothetical protein
MILVSPCRATRRARFERDLRHSELASRIERSAADAQTDDMEGRLLPDSFHEDAASRALNPADELGHLVSSLGRHIGARRGTLPSSDPMRTLPGIRATSSPKGEFFQENGLV